MLSDIPVLVGQTSVSKNGNLQGVHCLPSAKQDTQTTCKSPKNKPPFPPEAVGPAVGVVPAKLSLCYTRPEEAITTSSSWRRCCNSLLGHLSYDII